ncbi:hypothetical protein [Flavisphingomonas formosensis]|uniref:hypothetical protein n=1 Tax=Flavisphingomonas formosensis TaxID=861534 RepID=UPI0018DFCB3C|nr:hypothetical protein [Sphingomonas formosensis]
MALALAGATSQSCSLARVDHCVFMAELIVRKDFQRELRRFLGRGKESWTVPDDDKFDQVMLTLSASSAAPVTFDDGIISLGGCYPHICTQRAQVFFSPSGEIKAVALLYHECGTEGCSGDEDFTLRILVRQRLPQVEEHARQWAQSEFKRAADMYPDFGPYKLAKTVVQIMRD